MNKIKKKISDQCSTGKRNQLIRNICENNLHPIRITGEIKSKIAGLSEGWLLCVQDRERGKTEGYFVQAQGYLTCARWPHRCNDVPKHWGKRAAEDKMVRWHHQLSGHEPEQTLGDSGGQRNLSCYVHEVRHDLATEQQWFHLFLEAQNSVYYAQWRVCVNKISIRSEDSLTLFLRSTGWLTNCMIWIIQGEKVFYYEKPPWHIGFPPYTLMPSSVASGTCLASPSYSA